MAVGKLQRAGGDGEAGSGALDLATRARSLCRYMTGREFRRIALSLPQASEAAHMGHSDFRVAGSPRPSRRSRAAGVGAVQVR